MRFVFEESESLNISPEEIARATVEAFLRAGATELVAGTESDSFWRSVAATALLLRMHPVAAQLFDARTKQCTRFAWELTSVRRQPSWWRSMASGKSGFADYRRHHAAAQATLRAALCDAQRPGQRLGCAGCNRLGGHRHQRAIWAALHPRSRCLRRSCASAFRQSRR